MFTKITYSTVVMSSDCLIKFDQTVKRHPFFLDIGTDGFVIGITPIGEKLEVLLLNYLSGIEHAQELAEAGDSSLLRRIKPVNFLVITDGAPSKQHL